jgi:tetratricopeptide (TPR) repeat protein
MVKFPGKSETMFPKPSLSAISGIRALALAALILPWMVVIGCDRISARQGEALPTKVAKVDTDYVYETNVTKYVEDYQASRRSRISVFLGFSPDEILLAREQAIDTEVREAIKRLPGVEVRNSEVTRLAETQVEQLAWQLYRNITQDGADFGNVAREYSAGLNARDGGTVQPFGAVENPEPYQMRAYAMSVGDISEPFYAWDGWRIIRLEKIEDDPLLGKNYYLSMILLRPDIPFAEAEIVNNIARSHTVEVLDDKYNSRRALANGDFQVALNAADQAVAKDARDSLAFYLRARALWGLGRQEEAVEALRQAISVAPISQGLAAYYYYYLGENLQQLGRADEALEAFHSSFDNWRQDITLAYDLLAKFEEIGDDEYRQKVKDEIDIMAEQDAAVLAFGAGRSGPGGVITTDQGQVEGSSVEYEPGYAE